MLAIQFCQYASQIAQDGSLGPAEYRSAVSRAYYGTFHATHDFLRRVRIETPLNHGSVWNALLAGQDPAVVQAGSDLHTLYSDRHLADYRLANPRIETQVSAQVAVAAAFAVMAAFTTCLSDPTRTAQVEAALAAWVKKLPAGSGYKILP